MDTIPVRPGEELDGERLLAYLRQVLPDLPEGPLEVRQFPAGASNLTYLVRVGTFEAVLRRPPFGPVPPRAHDMRRESALLERIHPVFPLAPKPYWYCDDPGIIGAPFYLMERRRGRVVDQTFGPDITPTPALGAALSEAMVRILVAIHAIDWEAAGLASFGHPEGFLARQVEGWVGRWERARIAPLPETDAVVAWLRASVPPSPAPTVIHNDFKLNNVLWSLEDPTVPVAVLDWEMATIGDPLMDLGVSLTYWVEADDSEDLKAVLPTVTHQPGFYTRRAFVARYAELSGRDVSGFRFYEIFGYFKLAVVLQQIYARWYRGQTRDPRFATFDRRVRTLMLHAYNLVQGTGPV